MRGVSIVARGTPSPNPKLTWSSSLTTLSLLGRISATRLALDRSTTTCTNLIGFGGKGEEEVEEKIVPESGGKKEALSILFFVVFESEKPKAANTKHSLFPPSQRRQAAPHHREVQSRELEAGAELVELLGLGEGGKDLRHAQPGGTVLRPCPPPRAALT